MQITPKTRIAGLIGHPVAHSLSPVIHNHLYDKLGIDMAYIAFDVPPERVAAAVEGLCALGFAGFNITIPHKEAVYQMLDRIDTEAEIIGAVNTVKIRDGIMTGYNTDGQGFIQSLTHSAIHVEGKRIALLGAGGSARSIGVYLAKENPESIHIINRTYKKADVLAGVINQYKGCTLAHAVSELPTDTDIIINTTSLGMWPHTSHNPLKGITLDNRLVVCDIVYNPRKTAMLQYAAAHGCTVIEGIGMLIGQGLRAVEIWLDSPLPEDSWEVMLEAVNLV